MTKSKNQVALNEENIRKNKRHIFELECQASTSYAESLLLIADIEENRALLSRNFSAAFNGNRAIAVDNIEDLYRCRMLMVDALTAKTDVQQNFKSAMGNSLRIDLLENKFYLNEQLQAVAERRELRQRILIQVNTGEDPAKFGLQANETDGFLERALACPSLLVEGARLRLDIATSIETEFKLLF